jgi:hypothetical protein
MFEIRFPIPPRHYVTRDLYDPTQKETESERQSEAKAAAERQIILILLYLATITFVWLADITGNVPPLVTSHWLTWCRSNPVCTAVP